MPYLYPEGMEIPDEDPKPGMWIRMASPSIEKWPYYFPTIEELQYKAAVNRISEGSDDPNDVMTVLTGEPPSDH